MIKYIKIRENVKNPERANIGDSGIDFFIPKGLEFISGINPEGNKYKIDINKYGYIIHPGERVLIPLGIKVLLPEGYDLQFVNKSGIASKTGLITGACLIDNSYRGELLLNLINTSLSPVIIKEGQKIIQGVIRKVSDMGIEEITESEYLSETIDEKSNRGEGGFGSSGI